MTMFVLNSKDPRAIASELVELARGGIPVMACYEATGKGLWCHRAMAAEWLAEALGRPIPEVGFETLEQKLHPLMPDQMRRSIEMTTLEGRKPGRSGPG